MEDRDRLAKIGRLLSDKTKNWISGSRAEWPAAWPPARDRVPDESLAARVRARLSWDKSLEGSAIQVQATGGLVELTGLVRDLEQRQRAVELANSTVGVSQVADVLEYPEVEP